MKSTSISDVWDKALGCERVVLFMKGFVGLLRWSDSSFVASCFKVGRWSNKGLPGVVL
jgi:hypothetical protein